MTNAAEVITNTESYVRKELASDTSGHDWWHIVRVRNIALTIAKEENANEFVVELASLLHDILDYKFSGSEEAGPQAAHEWLTQQGVDTNTIAAVVEIIRRMSYKGASTAEAELSLEGNCVRDADRLDAMGAVGIARVFAYGGHVGRPIHNPDTPPQQNQSPEVYKTNLGTSINHFDEKLLLLRDRMITPTAQRIANHRHRVMETFLKEFFAEWSGQS